MTATLSPPRRAGASRPAHDPIDRVIRLSSALSRKAERFAGELLRWPEPYLDAADAAGLTANHLSICEDAAAILEAVRTWRAALDDINRAGIEQGHKGDALTEWRRYARGRFVITDLQRIHRWHDGPDDTRPGGFWGPHMLAAALVPSTLDPMPTDDQAAAAVADLLALWTQLQAIAGEGQR